MPAAIPASIEPLLQTYTRLIDAALPGFLEGLYLHGSLALGAFDPRMSDIDFIAVISRRASPDDVAALEALHRELVRRFAKPPLEGSYLQWGDLGRPADTIAPHPYIHDGILHASGHHDINHVTWWVLTHGGIAALGPPVEQLAIADDWGGLLAAMRRNMNAYWRRYTTDPRRIAWLLTDGGVQWAVLGVLRQYYTFREHAITSKERAGRYGLASVPSRWHALIGDALVIRAGGRPTGYRSRLTRAIAAWRFLRYLIAACNAAEAP